MCCLCVIANMNNMLVVCKLCYYMRIRYINMNWYENGISHFICAGTPYNIRCECMTRFWINYIGGLSTKLFIGVWPLNYIGGCDVPNLAHGVKRGCYFFFFNKLITFKLIHSYNVKHLTCTIFCSSGLQNIFKLHIWKCSTFTIFTLFTKTKHIQK